MINEDYLIPHASQQDADDYLLRRIKSLEIKVQRLTDELLRLREADNDSDLDEAA